MPRRRLGAAERRLRILRAGMQTFSWHGYERASMREIAREAGVTTPVLYDHFSSKRDLYTVLLEEQESSLRAYQKRGFGTSTGPDLARELLEGFFSWVENHPYAWKMIFRDVPMDPEVITVQRLVQKRSTAQVAEFVARGLETEFDTKLGNTAVSSLITNSIYSINNELAAWWLDHREIRRGEVVDLALDLLLSISTSMGKLRESKG